MSDWTDRWTVSYEELKKSIVADIGIIRTESIEFWLELKCHLVRNRVTGHHVEEVSAIMLTITGIPPDAAPASDTVSTLIGFFFEEDELNGIYEHKNEVYVRFREPESKRLILCSPSNSQFKRYITRLHNRLLEKPITEKMRRKTIINVEGLDATHIELSRRLGKRAGAFYFDLSNREGEVVKITPVDWTIEIPKEPIFISVDNHIPAFYPEKVTNAVEWFNKLWIYMNYDKRFLLLHKIAFLFSFLPLGPQPISVIHGEHGSAKSYFTKLWKMFVDPATGDNHTMTTGKQLTHILGASWFVAFDNVSGIKQAQSDILCQASTGGTSATRKLYTDGETFSEDLRSVVVLNGLNITPQQPDLLRRCLLFKFSHIPTSARKSEAIIQDEIRLIGPKVLGSVFTLIAKAMNLVHKYRNMKNMPIMADFAVWGSALCEALEEDVDGFLEEYSENRKIQSMQVAENDELTTILLDYLEELDFKNNLEIISKDDLLRIMYDRAKLVSESIVKDKYFPTTKMAITRKLNRIRPTLRELGFEYADERREKFGKKIRVFTFSQTNYESIEEVLKE